MDGTDLRDAALAQVEQDAHDEWKKGVAAIVASFPPGTEFTTDRVWWHLEQRGLTTHEPRAMGAAVKKLLRDKVVEKTGQMRETTRPQAHTRPIPVYRRV